MDAVRLVIVGTDLPGRHHPGGHEAADVAVGVQRGGKPDQVVPADAEEARWVLALRVRDTVDGLDVGGPYVHGRRGDRFAYVTWGDVSGGGFAMFRRAKITLDPAAPGLWAALSGGGGVTVRLGLTDACGQPLCARVPADLLDWQAG